MPKTKKVAVKPAKKEEAQIIDIVQTKPEFVNEVTSVERIVEIDNSIELEGVKNQDRSTFKMGITLSTAKKGTEITYLVVYLNGNSIKKTKRLRTVLEKDVENVLGYLRYQVAPRELEKADPEFVKVLRVSFA